MARQLADGEGAISRRYKGVQQIERILVPTIIFFSKYVQLYTASGNLNGNVDQQHNLQKINAKQTGSVLTAMTYWYRCVINGDVEEQFVVSTLFIYSLI
jgi:hypothetical protein